MKNLNQIIMLMLIVLSISSCTKTEDEKIVVPITLDCQAYNKAGTFVLEDRGKGVDYIVDCQMPISGDLKIMPGVVIEFTTDAGLNVSGSLQAIGTVENKIEFLGKDKGKGTWSGIFYNTNDTKNELSYCTINNAGGSAFNSNGDKGAIIIYSSTTLKVSNCNISDSKTSGIFAKRNGCELILEDNIITKCEVPIFIYPKYVGTISGGLYTGNLKDKILVYSYTSSIAFMTKWKDLGVPYLITDRLIIVAGGDLTINPGVTLEFSPGSYMSIDEGASGPKPSLRAVGTVTKPIIFTGENKVLGEWSGIYFDSPSVLNEIAFATIEYASNLNQEGAIELWAGTVLNVHDVTFNEIEKCAIYSKYNNWLNGLTTSNIIYNNTGGQICN